MKILVTGSAGFIGSFIVQRLLKDGHDVVGLDNINNYYDTRLKYGRLAEAGILDTEIKDNTLIYSNVNLRYRFIKLNLESKEHILSLFEKEKFDVVCNMAAQAGVRYSLENPYAYISSNVVGFMNILEASKIYNVDHLVYASSSSVYGLTSEAPFSENNRTDTPVSIYAATKKSNELMSYTYSKLYNIPTTGLRFFTVYGPWGRPDMAPMLFANAIKQGNTINVFNNGDLSRDFTYIDDIVEGVIRVIYKRPTGEVPYEIYNIGCSSPVKLMDFINILEDELGEKAEMRMVPMQKGDVYHTYADTSKLEEDFDYKPKIYLKEGIRRFVEWYKNDNPLLV